MFLTLIHHFWNSMMSWIRESKQQSKTVGGVEHSNFSDEEVSFDSYMNAIPGTNQETKLRTLGLNNRQYSSFHQESIFILSKHRLSKRQTGSKCSSWLLLLSKVFNSQSLKNICHFRTTSWVYVHYFSATSLFNEIQQEVELAIWNNHSS